MTAEINPNRSFSAEDTRRLKELVKQGCSVMQEIEILQESLNDTIKSIAEEMDIKPGQLKKAVKVAYKNTAAEERDKFTELDDILTAMGRS